MEFIRNQKYKISINEIGGGLNSIIDLESKKELIHEVNDGGWIYQDIMIFPFIGKYDYFYKNINYKTSSRHGFLRNKKLSFAKINENSILGTYESNNLDLLEYPFKFKILIKYELIDDKYNVNIEVFNLDNKTMPYSLGNHLGIKTNENSYIDLKNNNKLLPLKDGLIDLKPETFPYNEFCLKKEIFQKYDTIVLINKTHELKLVTLTHKFIYNFDSPLFAIWQNPSTNNFICIEPWWGIASYINEDNNIEKRYLINKLEPGQSKSYSFSLTILKN